MGKATEYSRNQDRMVLAHSKARVNNLHRQVYQGENAMCSLEYVCGGKRLEIGDVDIVLSASEEITSSTI